MTFLQEAVVFLAAAVIAVPLSRRLGVGAVLGYLVAGLLIGPSVLGFISDVDNILHFAELGVVLLLFVIGLELQPTRLWALRRSVFGLGTVQVTITALLLALTAIALGVPPIAAAIAGSALSLSSTAFALQLLAEKNQLTTQHGRASFAILLFQDLAAIPLLALIPLLGAGLAVPQLWDATSVAKMVAVLAIVAGGGRWLLRPLLRIAASSANREVFIAAALLVVMGTALLMQHVGLSMALGSFLAGVLLADSEYRHELEADIEPFKGLLLGLFFIAVGMSVDLDLVVRAPWTVLGLVLGLVAVKSVVLYGIARFAGQSRGTAVNLALYISQGGEFAFVLFGLAANTGAMHKPLADLLVVVVSASLVVTPLLVTLNDRILKIGCRSGKPREFDAIESRDNPVIIAGFGRVGQVVARILRTQKIPFTALEANFEQVDFVRKYGNKIYFGDASRLDLLHAAGAGQAKIFVLAIDDVEASFKTAQMVKAHYPHLKIYARARNRMHAYQLMDLGVTVLMRETFLSSLELARDVLVGLGQSTAEADEIARRFRAHDEELLDRQRVVRHDEEQLIATSRQARDELERLFEQDRAAVKQEDKV
jgi:glutathione-regulated potassium-efflux system ancillary protein KefC/glutathione-regulated potassium-efflux system protein KefB